MLGQTFAFDDLEAMTRRSEGEVEGALEEAARAGLMREVGRDQYAFDHALTQQSLYGELATRRRRRLHLAAGEAIEGTAARIRESRAAELAWHFLEGDDPERALRWALIAGDGAEVVFAHSDAELHYRTALQLARERGEGEKEAEALEKLGRALSMLARYDEELEVVLLAHQMSREKGDIEGEMRTAAAIGWAYFEVGRRGEGIEVLTPILERWREGGQVASSAAAALHVALGNLYWAEGKLEDALSVLGTGSELADAVGDKQMRGLAESRRGATLMVMGRIGEALEACDRAIALAELSDDEETISRTLNNRALLHGMYRNDWTRATADMERQIEVSRKIGKPAQIAWAVGLLGGRSWVTGNWPRARELLDEAAKIARQLGPSRSSQYIAFAAYVRLLTGEGESAARDLEQCIQTGRQEKDTMLVSTATENLADWELMQDRPSDARKRLESILGDPNLEEESRKTLRWLLASALVHEGEVDRADEMVSEGLPEARASASPPLIGTWLITQGIVRMHQGRWDEGRAAFEEALTIFRPRGNIVYEARVLHDYGVMEALRGDRDAARDRFEEELALLRRMGAAPVIERVERELAKLL